MEKIRNFVQNMFAGLPNTQETAAAQAHIAETMEDKYDALRAQGKNENEALGIVFGEFGSVEEIRAELGLGESWETPPESYPQGDFSREEYDGFLRRFAIGITSGVILCILGVAALLVMEQLAWMPEGFSIAIFLLIIAGAVGLFVYFGMQKARYDELQQAPVQPQKSDYHWEPRQPRGLRSRIGEAICSIIMLSALVIFLLMGFLAGRWHPGWIVFPVGGILCGIMGILFGTGEH